MREWEIWLAWSVVIYMVTIGSFFLLKMAL